MTCGAKQSEHVLEAFNECKLSLLKYIRRYTSRKDDPEDILQETFLRTFRAHEINNIEFPKTYMFKTAKNLAVREKTKMSARLTEYIEDYCSQALSSNEPSAFEELEKKQNREILISALNNLPPKCKRVTVSRLVYGMPLKQIAQEMGIALSTTEKHIAKGLEYCANYVQVRSENTHIGNINRPPGKSAVGVSTNDRDRKLS